MQPAPLAEKHVRPYHDWFWFSFSLVEKVARVLLTNHRAQGNKTKIITKILSTLNKPFYSCLLSDPAYEWQRGCRLYGTRCFYHVNCVVVMLTSLHLHKKSKELCIKTKSPAASLPFIGRVTEPQL